MERKSDIHDRRPSRWSDVEDALRRGKAEGPLGGGEELEALASGNGISRDFSLRLTRRVLIPLGVLCTVAAFCYCLLVLKRGVVFSALVAAGVWFVSVFLLGLLAGRILGILADLRNSG